MARLIAGLPNHLIVVIGQVVELVGLRILVDIDVRAEEVKAMAKYFLRFELERVIAFRGTALAHFEQRSVLRILHQQRRKTDGWLIVKWAGHLGGVQVMIEGVRYSVVEDRLVFE